MGFLLLHTGLLAYSAHVHSPTLDEPAHLVAGLSHWKFYRFDLYRVNPPLVRMVAALPVMVAGYNDDWSRFSESPGSRPVFGMGGAFVDANGERSFFLCTIARWACIPFSWVGAIVCYLWGRDLYGRPAGVLASFLWCFEPNILAHASLITADAGGTALGVGACYTFWRWLRKPTWTQAALTGVVLGLAELAKTTLVLFYPLWPLLWILYRWPDRMAMGFRGAFREAGMLSMRMAIGIYVVNLGYGFEGSFTALKDYKFISKMLTAETSEEPHFANRFVGTWLGRMPVPFPKNYVLGIDVQQRDFEDYGRPSYMRGKWKDGGWWYYYLYAGLIKVPLGGILLGVLLVTQRASRGIEYLVSRKHITSAQPAWRDELVLLAPAIAIFSVVSAKTGFSEHFRYALPAFPFLFIFVGSAARMGLTTSGREDYPSPGDLRCRHSAVRIVPATLVSSLACWLLSSSLWVYPHSLSYFNESIGGPRNGPAHLLGSNVDWGQDLLYLLWSPAAKSLAESDISYGGGFDVAERMMKGGSSTLPGATESRWAYAGIRALVTQDNLTPSMPFRVSGGASRWQVGTGDRAPQTVLVYPFTYSLVRYAKSPYRNIGN